MPLQILLVDDHKIMRAGIRAILDQSQEFAVIGEADSGSEAIAESKQKHPDVIVMDIGLPDMNGIEATKIIVRNAPTSKVIMLSIHDDEHSVLSSIRSGAYAYVLKKASGADLLKAIRTVAKGGSYLSPQVSDRLLQSINRVGPASTPVTSALEILAPRELQVFRLVAAGNSSKDIAMILHLGLETVRSYRKTMMKKLRVSNVAGVTQFAVAAGMALPNALANGPKPPSLGRSQNHSNPSQTQTLGR
jgi:DNA-binding NarL/FixJ family response regulator